jgi:predicted ABC-type ATPase
VPDSALEAAERVLVIVGGPNGGGKTTFAVRYSAMRGLRYLSADLIAEQLAPEHPITMAISAARSFSAHLDQALNHGESLIVESTLSGLSLRKPIQLALDQGYRVVILFVFLSSPDLCIARIRERVDRGGHNVPEADVARRFGRSLRNFWGIYRFMATEWTLYDNDGGSPVWVASGLGREPLVGDQQAFADFLRLAGQHEV